MQLATGSSEVKQLMSLHDKCSFIEIRMQNLVGDVGDTQRWLYQNLIESDGAEEKIKGCTYMCKLWVSSKLRFKDVSQMEFEPKFMKMWSSASSKALKCAEDWVLSRETHAADAKELIEAQAEVKIIKDVIARISFHSILNQLE